MPEFVGRVIGTHGMAGLAVVYVAIMLIAGQLWCWFVDLVFDQM